MKLPETPDEIMHHIGILNTELTSLAQVNEATARLSTLMIMAAELRYPDLHSTKRTDIERNILVQEYACERWTKMDTLLAALMDAERELRKEERARILGSNEALA